MNRVKRSKINMIMSLLGFAIPMGLNFFLTPFLVKSLGYSFYGLIGLVNIIMGYMAVLDMGMDIAIIKYLSANRAKNDINSENDLINFSLHTYLGIGIIGCILIASCSGFIVYNIFSIPANLHSIAINVFIIGGFGFLASMFNVLFKAIANGLQRYDISNMMSLLTTVFSLIVGVILIVYGYSIIGFLFARVLFTFLMPMILLPSLLKLIPNYKFKWGIKIHVFKILWNFTLYGFFLRVMGSLFGKIDQTLIGIWLGVTLVGVYSIPLMIVTTLSYSLSSTIQFTFPLISELQSQNNTADLTKIIKRGSSFMVLICGSVFIPLIIGGDIFLKLWIGELFMQKVILVFPILALAFYLNAIFTSFMNNIILGVGQVKYFTFYVAIRTIFLVVFCAILIKPFNILGASLAVLSTVIPDFIYVIISVTKYLKINIKELLIDSYLKIFVVGFILGLVSYLFKPVINSWFTLIVFVLLFEMAYYFLAYYFDFLDKIIKDTIISFSNKLIPNFLNIK